MWRWAPRKQKQPCRGLFKSLQMEKAKVGEASIQGLVLKSSPTCWTHCPGKVHSCGSIFSSWCQDQAKLEIVVTEVPVDLDGVLFQLAHSPFWKMFHLFAFTDCYLVGLVLFIHHRYLFLQWSMLFLSFSRDTLFLPGLNDYTYKLSSKVFK